MGRRMLLLGCLFALLGTACCLFEDQVGIDNWAQKNIGRVKSAVVTSRSVFVATDQSVLAALSPRNSDLGESNVLERMTCLFLLSCFILFHMLYFQQIFVFRGVIWAE